MAMREQTLGRAAGQTQAQIHDLGEAQEYARKH